MADETTVQQPAAETPAVPSVLTVEQAASLLEGAFNDDGTDKELPETREQEARQRDQSGRFRGAEKPAAANAEPAGEQGEPAAPTAPADWDDAQKAAFDALPPEHKQLVAAADAARQKALAAEREKHAEKLTAAERYEQQIKASQENIQKLQQITAEEWRLMVTLQGEFSDIKSADDRLALSDPNSPKYDPVRANRLGALIAMGQEIQRAKADAQANQKTEQDAAKQRAVAAQETRLLELVPEWGKLAREKDGRDKIKAEVGEIRKFLVAQGAPEEAVNSLYDAVSISVARKAMLYDKTAAEKAAADKAARAKLAAAPMVQKPGVGRTEPVERDQLDALKQTVRKTGRLDDAAKALERLM